MKKIILLLSIILILPVFSFAIEDYFETATTGYNPAIWSVISGGTFSQDTSTKYEGSSSLKIMDSDGTWDILRANVSSLLPNNNITQRVWVKIDTTPFNTGFFLQFTNDASDLCLIGKRYSSTNWEYYNGSTYKDIGIAVNTSWNELAITINQTGCFYYLNGNYKGSETAGSDFISNNTVNYARLASGSDSTGRTLNWDSFQATGGAYLLNATDFLNFTSDGGQLCGYNSTSGSSKVCGPTEDATPTFRLSTSISYTCKIWNESKNWTTLNNMGVPDCATTGANNHVCTYPEPLKTGNNTLYFPCKTGSTEINSYSSLHTFNISIQSPIRTSQDYANDAIDLGITKSSIWPGALVYTFQPVYIRIRNGSQAYGTFDKVAVYGSQRWAFNYKIDNESFITPFYNISPVFYFWQAANLSYWNTTYSVANFINSTKI